MKLWVSIATLFSAALLIQAAWFRHTKSITFDETLYLGSALETLHDGKLDPRLASLGVAPLPIALNYLPSLSFILPQQRPSLAEGKPEDAHLIHGPRLTNSILMGVPLLLIVSAWLLRRRGVVAAAAGAGLMAFSPSIIAHASLATTDACFALFALLALAAIAWYFSGPSRLRFIMMAAAIAAAMAAKYSGVFLLPVVAILFLLHPDAASRRRASSDPASPPSQPQPQSWRGRLWDLTRNLTALLLLILPLWWGLHLFSFTGPLKNLPLEQTPDASPWVQILGRSPAAEAIMRFAHENLRRPAPLDGVLYQYLHNRGGHTAFLMGERSVTGWWYFFPLAMLMKSTPVELLLLAGLLVSVAASLRSPWRAFRSLDTEIQTLAIATLVYSLLLLTSRINIGHRYLLPLYPLLILMSIDSLWRWLGPRPRIAFGTAAALVLAQAAGCLAVVPHYLAYFNPIVGGPQQGWHYLVDSSIDWGQDLPALARELQRRGYRHVALQYFGTADPRAYGVQADRFSDLQLPIDRYQAVAISVTNLQGLYIKGDDPFRELRRLPPVARAGYSILIYDLSDRRARRALEAAILARPSRLEEDNSRIDPTTENSIAPPGQT